MGSKTNGFVDTDSGNPLTSDVKNYVKDRLDEWNIAGAAIAIIDGDNTYSEAFGFASLPDVPATEDTLWYFGSAIKTSTAAILAHLIDSKEHPLLAKGWATPVTKILPDEFVLPDEWATKHITLEDLVCHNSGIDRHDFSIPALDRDGAAVTLTDQIRKMRRLSFKSEPRAEHSYCNYGYLTLSCVIEKVTGKAFKDVLRDLVWKPLGMDSTYYSAEDTAGKIKQRLSNGYRWDSKAKKNILIGPGMSLPAAAGAGAGITTVRDLAKLVHCLVHETDPFSKTCHKDMKRPRVIAVPEPHLGTDISTYGLGVYRTIYRNQPVYSHPGTIDSHGSEVVWLPELKFGVVLMANGSGTSNRAGKALVYKFIDDKLGIPEAERTEFNTMFVTPCLF
ncbi:hypothetical protein K4F52_002636 [Lecanicillium sp. MT-2017a]|nr:hypothetical protein K4F52_002636 [Lecanicillium sp. MT-2017a]